MAVDERHRRAEPGPTAPPRQPTHPRRHGSHPGSPLVPPSILSAFLRPAPPPPPPPLPPPPPPPPPPSFESHRSRLPSLADVHAATADATADDTADAAAATQPFNVYRPTNTKPPDFSFFTPCKTVSARILDDRLFLSRFTLLAFALFLPFFLRSFSPFSFSSLAVSANAIRQNPKTKRNAQQVLISISIPRPTPFPLGRRSLLRVTVESHAPARFSRSRNTRCNRCSGRTSATIAPRPSPSGRRVSS